MRVEFMRTIAKRQRKFAATWGFLAVPIGIAIAVTPFCASLSRAQTLNDQVSPELTPQFLFNQRAMTVIGQGLAAAPADTARLEFSLGLRLPPELNRDVESDPSPEEFLQPVISALTESGVSRNQIQIQAVQIENPRVQVTVTRPTRESLQALIERVNQSLRQSEALFLQSIGAEYGINNCQFLERQARRAALNDAQTRARNLAADLGVNQGEVLRVTEYPLAGSPASGACGSKIGVSTSPFGPASDNLPPYNPAAPTEVQLRSQVSITYTIEEES
ncbi:MAG: SIMPL domain-containing protein [Desertifilum sp. SIO1I2]|nr:SIMPL domain-containing protein [Desertifilum sp. SIO1I2]